MKYKPPKFEKLRDMASIDVGRLTEDEARAILEGIRWPKGPVCPHCGSMRVVRIQAKSEKIRDGVIRCNDCQKQFTVTVKTIMHRSHITLRQWVQAFYSMCSHKKGVSALQLQRNLGLHSYKSAWHLAHRIRAAMGGKSSIKRLKGTVEVDETYIGGKPRRDKNWRNTPNKNGRGKNTGRGTKKTPVMVLVERQGDAVSKPVERVDAANLKSAIRETVDRQSTIMTDEWKSYRGIGREFAGGHSVVNHGMGEYVNGDKYTNTAESYFALLKRGVHGVFHHVSKQHLPRYCGEFSFRWNYRKVNDGTRAEAAIRGTEGKRLVYKKAFC
jgi:transposase-like protein